MKQIRYLPSADDDLLDIYVTIAIDNEAAANRTVDRIRDSVRRLSDYPLSAPSCATLSPELRGLSVGRHITYYRVTETEVLIVRVLHAARDAGAADFGEPS